ncbi:MAG: hypothetical protein ACLP62_12310 [Acidimicrobiales bacterium]
MGGDLDVGRLEEPPGWHDDVALELWVDAERIPVLVRLAGTLDEATSASLRAVVADLLGSGVRQFEFVTDGLRKVEPGGWAALEAVAGMVERSGGTVRRLPPHTWSDASGGAGPAGR